MIGAPMSKQIKIIDHTADVGLEARADSLGELFEALAEGLAGLICPREAMAAAQSRDVAVRAEDVEALAVDFLTAVLNIIQTRHFMVARVKVAQIDSNRVVATLHGEPYQPQQHEIGMEIKAVTYHQLRIAQQGGGWIGTVILDI